MKPEILIHIAVLQCIFAWTLGCQPQMCRRKRQIAENPGRVRLRNLVGCSSRLPRWTRQIAYCLNLVEATMVFRTKEWYQDVYPICEKKGCLVLNDAKDVKNIEDCVRCWKEKIFKDNVAGNFTGAEVTAKNITDCVNDYIYAFLNQSQPTLEALSRHKYEINIPESRPANFWWSVTVDLPCKPKHFVFFNAYCINSFGTDIGAGDYVLVRNKLFRTNSGMTFFVDSTEDCTIRAEDIKIIWSESSPTPGLPQTGSLSTSFIPGRRAPLNIYYDVKAAERLTGVDGGFVEEYDTAAEKSNGNRGKREADTPQYSTAANKKISKLGLAFPCVIGSLQVPNGISRKRRPYRIIGSRDNKYLIDMTALKSGNGQTSIFRFNLNFGNAGCFFDAGDVVTLPNPPPNWLGGSTTGLACVMCQNARSDEDCTERGSNTICKESEVCQTEIRHISRRHKLITKSCKHRTVCKRNSEMKKTNSECGPGRPGSVCFCCCDSDLCNDKSTNC